MKIRDKNSSFQSCHYCFIGGAVYRVDLDNGDSFYICEKHCVQIPEVYALSNEGIEEEFGVKAGLVTRALNYIKGG